MREDVVYSGSDGFEEEFVSLLPEKCRGYIRVLFFFIHKYLEDPTQAFSAYTVEKEVVGISRARPILDRLVKAKFIVVTENDPFPRYKLNSDKEAVKRLLNLFK